MLLWQTIKSTNSTPDWLKDFGWLVYDAKNMKMFCTFCKEAPSAMAGSSLFITGNPNLKRDAVVKHIESTRHSRCPDFYINRTQSQPNNPGTVEAEIGAVLCSLNVISLFISLNFALVNWCCWCVQFLQADKCSKQKPIVLLHFLTWGHECS